MDIAYIRHHPNAANLEITFQYKNLNFGIERTFNFQRNINESIEMTFGRIKTNIEKEIKKKAGGKKKKPNKDATNVQSSESSSATSNPDDVIIGLFNGNVKIDSITWMELFADENKNNDNLVLKVSDKEYAVTYNYPYVNQIALPTIILIGFNCYPSKFEVFFTERDECLFEWFRGKRTDDKNDANIEWVRCENGSSFFYMVQEKDIRHKLKLIVTPKKGDKIGQKVELTSKCVVEPGAGYCAFKEKQLFTPNRLESNQFRVISYNLLADYYADSDFSRKELFPYCPPFALHIDYRKLLFIREILGYHSDIACLQEVDAKVFDIDLKICLGNDGLHGIMQKKGDTAEGVATFYHCEKFDFVEKYGLNLSEHMAVQPYFAELYDNIKNNEKLCERMLSLSTALLVNYLLAQ